MIFQIEITDQAAADLGRIKTFHRSEIMDAIEEHLSHKPTQVSRSRIKRLRLIDSPAYRLRVGEYRVYYDIDESNATVTVLRVHSKDDSIEYLSGAGGQE